MTEQLLYKNTNKNNNKNPNKQTNKTKSNSKRTLPLQDNLLSWIILYIGTFPAHSLFQEQDSRQESYLSSRNILQEQLFYTFRFFQEDYLLKQFHQSFSWQRRNRSYPKVSNRFRNTSSPQALAYFVLQNTISLPQLSPGVFIPRNNLLLITGTKSILFTI